MPKKRTEPRGLNRKIAQILGVDESYCSKAINGKIGVSDERAAQIAAAKEQARKEIETFTKIKAAKKAQRLQILQNA